MTINEQENQKQFKATECLEFEIKLDIFLSI